MKASRKVFFFAGLIVVCAVILILLSLATKFSSEPNTQKEPANNFQVDSFDDFRKLALMVKEPDDKEKILMDEKIRLLEDKLVQLQDQLMRLGEELRGYASKPQTQDEVNDQSRFIDEQVSENLSTEKSTFVRPSDLQVIKFGNTPSKKTVAVPAGTFARATLLTGVYAPVNSNPLPVLLKLDSIGIGPNRSLVPVDDAFVIAKGVGDSNSSRAIIQLETLSLVRTDGTLIDKSINGYVADTDGIQGLKGKYVYSIGDVGFLSVTTAGMSIASDALSEREASRTTNSNGSTHKVITGDPLKYVAGKAMSGTLDKISQIFEKRMDEVIPAVFVPNGKQVTVIFLNSVVLDGFEFKEASDESEHPSKAVDFVK